MTLRLILGTDERRQVSNFRSGLNLRQVEDNGIEPLASCMPCKRSPS